MMRSDSGKKKSATAMDYALRALARRRFSVRELENRLHRRKFNEDDVSYCISRLLSWGYLNDEELARDVLTSLIERCPIGKIRAVHELRKRGFSQGLIQETVDSVYEGLSELQLASAAVLRYLNGKDLSSLEHKDRTRLFRWLLNRGFDHSVVYSAVFAD
jgi:SOS response regulatory protein OraA/RecX